MLVDKSPKKILILELILNDLAKLTYQCLIMTSQGKVVVTSDHPPPEEDQRLTQKLIEVADFSSLIGRPPEDILFNLKDRRLYFQKLYSNRSPADDPYIGIVFPTHLRAYRRTIKQCLRQLRPFLE